MYAQLPSYQAMFEREGNTQTGDLALIGSEPQIEELLGGLAAAGVTDYAASEFGLTSDDHARTRELLKRIVAAG